jgi:hypothetical protein
MLNKFLNQFVSKETIFIQIASYRDPELLSTLKDLLETASDPTR